ncbi:MAG: 3-phosphoshikimate 1-carboxyvinyltransferase [Actinomycetota bacterium]|nr:3-phosphoshikimate 1-carboxyvinyltransferase [Actinomycetota bacterium]
MDLILSGAGPLRGEVSVPPDKSISHRAAILGAMARGRTTARPFLGSRDCMSTLSCLRALGVELDFDGDTLTVIGDGLEGWREAADVLDAGNSATTMRFMAGALSGRPFLSMLTGDESLRTRPMSRIVDPLRLMGAEILAREGGTRPPLAVSGGDLEGIEYELEVESAQVKSAILLAGMQAVGVTRVIGGRASRDHTERMMRLMGADISFEGERATLIKRSSLEAGDLHIPGDISSASFLLAAAVLVAGSRLTIKGVGLNPTRAGFLSVLNSMGALVMESNYEERDNEPRGDLEVGSSKPYAIELEACRVPAMIDEVPLMAVVGCRARGTTVVRGAWELRVKESDRISAICGELARMGADIEELPDGFAVRGPRDLRGAAVDSHGDHRIAMSLAVAALCAEGETAISGWECVDISYPGFEQTLRRIMR